MHRRAVLRLAALAGLAAGTAGCRDEEEPAMTPEPRTRHAYGEDPSQWGDLFLPEGEPRGVVVVVHGGFWKAEYGAEQYGGPLASDLADRGWVAWNLEYRRVGNGGGVPATFDDVAAGIDHLGELDLDLTTVVTLGHSAGGHLATWAAARGGHGWAERVPVTHVISQAGVLDLRAADADGLGGGAVRALLGHAPTATDARFDPAQQLPLDVPVWCVHGQDDDIVPPSQSASYVERARAAGATAELLEVPGDHFAVIDPAAQAWARQVAVLDTIGRTTR